MLGNKDPMATIAVKDLRAAEKFYEQTLGLRKVDSQGEEAVVLESGSSVVLVYRSKFAGTNQATAMTYTVGDGIAAVVKGLKDKGVAFEHYDMPDMKLEGDVHVMGDMKAAWFKDPDGNIIALTSR
jgi:catechol-2,3-dioxygenase